MPVNSTHPQYDANVESWQRIRDVLAGDAIIKRRGEKYVARLDSQTDQEYQAYVQRSFFYNATARTVAGYLGLIFRKDPILEVFTDGHHAEGRRVGTPGLQGVLEGVFNDVDLVGTTLDSYAKSVVQEVIAMGRAGTLVDWCASARALDENRAYLTMYAAEEILNWRESRINGSLRLSLVVLSETACVEKVLPDGQPDPFVVEEVQQIRVLRLVPQMNTDEHRIETTKDTNYTKNSTEGNEGACARPPENGKWQMADGRVLTDGHLENGQEWEYQVEIWQLLQQDGSKEKEWKLVEVVTPLRLGKPLNAIPFVFHGPTSSRPEVEKSPVEDIVAANLDHYRLNTDYKHGMHFTALPTAFVTGFDKTAQLRIGSTTAWVTETIGATAQYLEFQGDGLMSFERALDRCERLMASLGSRLLQGEQTFAQSAEAMALREKGEESVIASLAGSVSASLNEVLGWVYWWHSSLECPGDVTEVRYELNRDFNVNGLGAGDLQALVTAWQNGAISRETLLHNLRAKDVLPPGRSEEEEMRLIRSEPRMNTDGHGLN